MSLRPRGSARRDADPGRSPRTLQFIVLAGLLTPARAAGATEPVYETVVTAPPPARAREDAAAASSVVTADRTPRAGESVADLLAEQPGVTVTRLGGLGAPASVSLRGSAANQVAVFVDGVPMTSATGGGTDLSLLPLFDTDRIEIYRGSSPMAFGTSAIGGIVSLTSRMPTESSLSGELGLGSWGTRLAGGSAAWVGTRMRVAGAVHLLDAAGNFPFVNDRGTGFDTSDDSVDRRQNNALNQLDAVVRSSIDLPGRRRVQSTLSLLRRTQGVPGLAIFPTRDARVSIDRLLAQVAYDGRGDLGDTSHLRADAYATLLRQNFHDVLPEIAASPTETHDRTLATGATLRATKHLGPAVRLTALLDARHDTFAPFDERQAVPAGPPGTRTSGAAGIETGVWWRALDLEVVPSARLEAARDVVTSRVPFTEMPFASAPTTHVLPVLRLAAIERPVAGFVVRGNLGRYVRLPSMTERYGNNGFLLANPALRAETGINADLGAGFEIKRGPVRATGDVAAFLALADDLIQYQQNAQGQARAANIGRARITGVETSATLMWSRYARVFGQATYADARDRSDTLAARDKELPLRPRWHVYTRPELRALPLGPSLRGGLYADVDVTSSNYRDAANIVRVPTRILFGAGVFIEQPSTGLRLVASAQNLGDARVFDLAGYPLPGRSVYLTLAFRMPPSKEID